MSTTEHHNNDGQNDYTDKEIRVGPLFIFMISCLIITGLTFIGITVLFKSFNEEHARANDLANAYSLDRQLPQGGAVLQGFQEAAHDLQVLRAEEDALLTHYEWVDKDNGVARIPIEQAMTRVVEKGLPVRGASE